MRFLLVRLLPILIFGALIAPSDTARAQTVQVPITFHRQEHSLSCEIATLKMALGSHGITVTESDLIQQLPFDLTPKKTGTWGNPNRGFVGNIDGLMMRTGYGVHWDPIAKVGNNYVHTDIIKNTSAAQLARHIVAGNPVIMWGHYGTGTVHTWKTSSGEAVRAVNGEHTRVVYGFDGPVSAPTHFYVMDPLTGPLTWSTTKLMNNWSSFNHTGVVVTKHPRWARVPGDSKVWEIRSDGTTRRWVPTWAEFTARGGRAESIKSVTATFLESYRIK